MTRYQLTSEQRRSEREWLKFELELHGDSFLSFDVIARTVHPERTYQTWSGRRKNVLTGSDLLSTAHQDARLLGCSFIKTITEVPEDFEQPPEEYWDIRIDPDTGKKTVSFPGSDVWDTSWFTLPPYESSDPRYEIDLELVTEMVIRRHWPSPTSDRKAISAARPSVSAALNRGYTSEMAYGKDPEVALGSAMTRAGWVFDVAYHRARIENAGIDLDQHARFRDYQTFFDLGMRPPTHEEMADKIIELAGNSRTRNSRTRHRNQRRHRN